MGDIHQVLKPEEKHKHEKHPPKSRQIFRVNRNRNTYVAQHEQNLR